MEGVADFVLPMTPNADCVVKAQLFRNPFMRGVISSTGYISNADPDKLLDDCADSLAKGNNLIIFPEGTRVAPGDKPPLQSGFAGLYKLINLPVVPIAVNSGTLSPRKTGIWKSGTITYKVGEELPTGLPREEIEARVHAAINALN